VMMDDNADEDANLCFVDLRDDHDGCLEIRRDGTFFFRLLRVRQRDRETLRTSGVWDIRVSIRWWRSRDNDVSYWIWASLCHNDVSCSY
jgi:hypothetical protein